MDATPDELAARFPWPAPPHPAVVPAPIRHAGWSSESTDALLAALKDNHTRWHIFFNEKHFHNHATHHLLAIYAMGAPAGVLGAAYHTHEVYQKPAFPPPETDEARLAREAIAKVVIDDANWKDFLGDERYYQAYVSFFARKLQDKSAGKNAIQRVLETYVFSDGANLAPGKSADGQKPLMLGRFLGGFLHPLIHAGYGAEFSLPGLIAEGIAEAAVQASEADALFTPELFGVLPAGTFASRFVSFIDRSSVPPSSPAGAVHALAVLAKIAKDPAFEPRNVGLPVPPDADEKSVDRVVRLGGTKLVGYLQSWFGTVAQDAPTLRAKFEEIAWMNTTIYAVGGWAGRELGEDEKKEFNGDFFLMHLVTSTLLMSSLLNVLTPKSAALLLKTYFAFSIVLYIARGRPPLPIAEFYAATSAHPHPPGAMPEPDKDTLPPSEPRAQLTPNPWLALVQSTLVHPNEHFCKAQRALYHYAEWLGGVRAGAFADCAAADIPSVDASAQGSTGGQAGGLTGAKHLDGTLFVRAAGLTAARLGWMREGEAGRGWDSVGFFPAEQEERRVDAAREEQARMQRFRGAGGMMYHVR
ncbi:questin oxidase family protein [Phanerochaete sordida]|uniref:Questin oxidase family protein n=1 Tax=Phanerochaete sordida TaxID=48140 RepID=A0A9P3GH55_9APHY|nr:questin oxidase family protein [Phanerochaete sordida]